MPKVRSWRVLSLLAGLVLVAGVLVLFQAIKTDREPHGWVTVMSPNPIEVPVLENQSPLVDYVVKNSTSKTLRLRVARRSCSCFSVLLDGNALNGKEEFAIQPMQSRVVSIGKMSDSTATQLSPLSLQLDDCEDPSHVIALECVYKRVHAVKVSPSLPTVDFYDAFAITKEFDVTYASSPGEDRRKVSLKLLPGPCDVISVERRKTLRNGGPYFNNSWRITLRVKYPDGADEHGHFVLRHPFQVVDQNGTRSAKSVANGEITLLAQRRYGPVVNKKVFLGLIPLGKVVGKVATISAADEVPFSILDIKSPSYCKIDTLGAGPLIAHQLQISCIGQEHGPLNGEVVVTTDHEKIPVISFGISGLVSSTADNQGGVDTRK